MRASHPSLLSGVPAAPVVTARAWQISLPLILGLLAYVYGLSQGRGMLLDGDTLSHIVAGRWMLEHGVVPTQDPFSHTMRGAPWTAHEWLAQVVLAASYAAGGFNSVVALTAAAFAVTVAIFSRVLLRFLEPIYVLLFVILAAVMTSGHLLARPHILALPFLVAWMCELVRARSAGESPQLFMLALMTVWANLHGGFTLGLLLAGLFAVEAVIEAPAGARRAAARSWGLFLVLAFAFALLTPHGLDGILFTWHMLTNLDFTLSRVGEWRSPDFHQPQPLELWLLAALGFALMRGVRFPPVRVAIVLLLAHLALKHIRNVELLGLLGPLALAPAFAAHRNQAHSEERQLDTLDRAFQKLSAPAGRGAIVVTLLALVLVTGLVDRMRTLEPMGPAKAVQAARAAHLSGPVFNAYSWGGYLMFIGIPPFIDGRADMYGDAHVKEFIEATAPTSADTLHKVLDKYHVTWTLLDSTSLAIPLLDLSPDWRRVYADEQAVVHARIQAVPAGASPQSGR